MRQVSEVNDRGTLVAECRLPVEAWLLATLVGLGLRCIRFHTLLVWLARLAGTGRRRETAISPERVARIVEAAAARSVGQTCLSRALVLRHVLEQRGIAADLLLSTRRSVDLFEAHASVRVGGRTLLGDAGDGAPLWRHGFVLPRSGP